MSETTPEREDVKNERYCYSLNEEDYEGEYASREEALEAATEAAQDKADCDGTAVHFVRTALAVSLPVRSFVERQADFFIDSMRDAASDEVGDWSESWLLHVKSEDEQRLGELLADAFEKWMKETGHEPHCYAVDKAQEHEVEIEPSEPEDGDDGFGKKSHGQLL